MLATAGFFSTVNGANCREVSVLRSAQMQLSPCLHLRRCISAGDALPFTIRHLHPGIHPAFMGINRLAIVADAFASSCTGGDGRVPKRGHFDITDLLISLISHLLRFILSSDCDLLYMVPSLSRLTQLSARSGATASALPIFPAAVHCWVQDGIFVIGAFPDSRGFFRVVSIPLVCAQRAYDNRTSTHFQVRPVSSRSGQIPSHLSVELSLPMLASRLCPNPSSGRARMKAGYH